MVAMAVLVVVVVELARMVVAMAFLVVVRLMMGL